LLRQKKEWDAFLDGTGTGDFHHHNTVALFTRKPNLVNCGDDPDFDSEVSKSKTRFFRNISCIGTESSNWFRFTSDFNSAHVTLSGRKENVWLDLNVHDT